MTIFTRIATLSFLVFLWPGLSWIFVLQFASYYFEHASYQPVAVPFWLLNTVIPIFPGLGALAAIVGIVTKDKLVSFSVGFVPHILNWIMYSSLSALGSATVYSGIEEMTVGLFTLLAAGSGLGLLGMGGAFYGSFHEKGSRRLARLSLVTFLSGFFLWLFVVWGWPGWGATVPGLSKTLGF